MDNRPVEVRLIESLIGYTKYHGEKWGIFVKSDGEMKPVYFDGKNVYSGRGHAINQIVRKGPYGTTTKETVEKLISDGQIEIKLLK